MQVSTLSSIAIPKALSLALYILPSSKPTHSATSSERYSKLAIRRIWGPFFSYNSFAFHLPSIICRHTSGIHSLRAPQLKRSMFTGISILTLSGSIIEEARTSAIRISGTARRIDIDPLLKAIRHDKQPTLLTADCRDLSGRLPLSYTILHRQAPRSIPSHLHQDMTCSKSTLLTPSKYDVVTS